MDLDADLGHDDRRGARSDIPWIELFLDLVFIAALIQAGDRLVEHLGIAGLAEFTIVFALLWWAWSSITIHFARRNSDDAGARLIVFVFVAAIALLGVVAGRGVMGHTAAFALLYALVRLCLAALYADLAWRDAKTRRLALRFAAGFGSGAVLWAVSAMLPEPWRYVCWAVAIAAEVATGMLQDRKELRAHLSLDAGRLSERYGQLTLIVLGESFIKITAGLVGGPGLTPDTIILTVLALVFIGAVFWAYYGDIAGATIRKGRARLWTYLHLPLMMSIAALGVSFHPITEHEAGTTIDTLHHRMLHFCAAATFFWLAMIDIFARTSDAPGGWGAGASRLASAGLLGASWALGGGIAATVSVGIAAFACAAPVALEAFRRPHDESTPRAEVRRDTGDPPPPAGLRAAENH